jgi:hypothetical protein
MPVNPQTKYSESELNEFWKTVDALQFNQNKDAKTIRKDLLKKMPPHQAETLKSICDDYTYYLNERVGVRNTKTLFNCFAAVAAGKEFYDLCLKKLDTLDSLNEEVNIMNTIGNCFPTSDDYFFPDSEEEFTSEESNDFNYEYEEEYDDYDDNFDDKSKK